MDYKGSDQEYCRRQKRELQVLRRELQFSRACSSGSSAWLAVAALMTFIFVFVLVLT